MNKESLSIVRQSFANTVFTHKMQELSAEYNNKKALNIKITNIIIVSLVLVLLLWQYIQPKEIILTYIASGLSVTEVIFLTIQLTFSFEQQEIMHKKSALKYMELRGLYIALIADIMDEMSTIESIKKRRDDLQHVYQIICELSPQTRTNEYPKAQEKLNKRGVVKGEEFTWSDDEIDHFLPEILRLKK